MVEIVSNIEFNRDEMETKFRQTFLLIDKVLGASSFQKYNEGKDRFEGKFLVAAFEAVAIGLGKNIHLWQGMEINDALITSLTDKIKSIWGNAEFQERYGSGVNVTARVPVIIPLGERILRP